MIRIWALHRILCNNHSQVQLPVCQMDFFCWHGSTWSEQLWSWNATEVGCCWDTLMDSLLASCSKQLYDIQAASCSCNWSGSNISTEDWLNHLPLLQEGSKKYSGSCLVHFPGLICPLFKSNIGTKRSRVKKKRDTAWSFTSLLNTWRESPI